MVNLSIELSRVDRQTLNRIATTLNDYQSRSVDSDKIVRRMNELIQQGKDERKLLIQRAAKGTYEINDAIQEADLNQTWG